MAAPPSQILVDGAISRLENWMESLEGEFASAAAAHRERQDLGADKYLALLRALLGVYQRAFKRYRSHATAPVDQRLRWLQQVGAGLAELESRFGRVSVPVAPTLTPMLAAFSRLLEKLVPGRRPIFRPVRDFNYELEEFHSSEFVELLLSATTAHEWPILFITLPTGILDTPRAHVLVAHELGHAVAAVHRERVDVNERERDEATAAGNPPPAVLVPLLPQATPTRKDVLMIAKERWAETNLPAPQLSVGTQPSADLTLFMQLVAEVGADVDDLVQAWLEELFSDALGTCLFGPAFLTAMVEVLLTTGPLDRGTATHPPLAARLRCIGRTLQHADLGYAATTFPTNLKDRFETSMASAEAVLTATVTINGSGERLDAVARSLVLDRIDDVVAIAIDHAKRSNVLYTAPQFERDTRTYVGEFVQAGVPPLGKDVSLASVFNVGQVLCSDHLASFCPGSEVREKELRVDDLLLKAIELNEIATAWGEA